MDKQAFMQRCDELADQMFNVSESAETAAPAAIDPVAIMAIIEMFFKLIDMWRNRKS